MKTRQIFSSLNLVTVVVLLGVLFIMLNWVASRRYARWDFTKQKISMLSDQTIQTLRSLDALSEPVSIVVFYEPRHRLYELAKDLLKEYSRASSKIHVEYIDPQQDLARARQLVQQFQIEQPNVVVFQFGPRHKHLSETELADYDYASMGFGGEPRVKAFKGEDTFTSAIINITTAQSPLIWITTGHGEKSVEAADQTGLADLKKYLEQQNMTVSAMNLLEQPNIPPDVKLIIMPGPTHRLTDAELTALRAYLERGGRLLALIDPLTETGLAGLLESWGVTLGNDIVVDPARQLPFVSAANLFVTTYTQHPIVEKMKTLMTLFPLARSVRPATPAPAGITVNPLALTSETGWGEIKTSEPAFEFQEGEDLKGPVSIGVAAERTAPQTPPAEGTTAAPTRLVVIGDSDFVINAQLQNVGNRDLILGTIYWLIEQERLIGIGPKVLESIKLNLNAAQLGRLFWFSFLAMPLLCGLCGVGVWWVRRR